MGKSALLRTSTLFLGILICLASIPATFAQEDLKESVVEKANASVRDETVIHDISPGYYDMYLQQGESESFTVSFKNNDKKALEIEPKIVAMYYSDTFDESWITVSPANVTVEAGAEQEFTIEVSIPEDEDGGYYETYIAFTDDVYSEEDIYSEYVNAMYLSISVPIYQKLELQTSYISDSIEAGMKYEYTVKIKNAASKSITIDPEVTQYDYSFDEFILEDEEIEITAPSTLEPGQIADMIIKVPVPENATGTYNGYIDMNVEGDEYGYEPQLDLYLTVLQKPSIPYKKNFSTKNADPITIEISTYDYSPGGWLRYPPKDEVPSFELNAKYNSNPVDLTLVKTTQSNSIYIGWDCFSEWSIEDGDIYQDSGSYYTETYTMPGAIGDWEIEILPENIEYFDYSITIGDLE